MDVNSQKLRVYDLEERTSLFGENILKFIKTIKINNLNRNIISQLIRSATSVGANYMEATMAESRKDFIHKIRIVSKEIKETRHWIRMLANVNPELKERLRIFWQEAHELTLIFSKSIKTSKNNQKK